MYYWLKAESYLTRGNTAAARAAWDSALLVGEPLLAARGSSTAGGYDAVEEMLALAHAGLGQKGAAIQLGREGTQRLPVQRDAMAGANWLGWLVEVYVRAGEHDAALDQLEYLLSIPSLVSISLLRVDPLYAPLRGNPRFERLLRGAGISPASSK